MEALATLRNPQAGCSSSYGAARTSFCTGIGSKGGSAAGVLVRGRRRGWWAEEAGRSGLCVQAKGRKNMMPGRTPSAPTPTMPKLDDDDNPKFVIFIRTKIVPRWYPLSIVSGGTTAKMMLAAMGNKWGRKLYEGTLTRNMASVVYKDERTIRQTAFKTYPVLKSASGFMYGYKIVDAKNPRSALTSSDVIEIPPQEELLSFVDRLKEGFTNLASGVKDTFGAVSPISPEPESEPEPTAEPKQRTKKKAK